MSVQANKNTLLKGMVGTSGIAAALAVKAWWQPSFWFALSAGFDFHTRLPKFGCTFGTENYGNIRSADMVISLEHHVAGAVASVHATWGHAP